MLAAGLTTEATFVETPSRHSHLLRLKDLTSTAGAATALSGQELPGVNLAWQRLLLGAANTAVDLTVGPNKHLAIMTTVSIIDNDDDNNLLT